MTSSTLTIPVAGAFFALCVWQGALADELHLMCNGTARYVSGASGFGFGTNNRGSIATASTYGTSGQQAADEFLVDISGDHGRVKVPSSLWPVLHGDLHDGWVPLKSLSVSDSEVDATYALSAFDTHALTISRTTGHVDVHAVGGRGFSGDCQVYDPAAAARKF